MDSPHPIGKVIKNRYRVLRLLGQGGMGKTYSALDLETDQPVALKIVSLTTAKRWKTIELFEREAKVLATLNHPRIPNYLDYFEDDSDTDLHFYLVQELVAGKSLAQLVADGWHGTEAEIQAIAIQALQILAYIHQLHPPIVHRDLKPQNLILAENNELYMVDFGAVKSVYGQPNHLQSKTLVGTFGYMPFEQFEGRIYGASDLYSLGCTLIFLLTHRSPAELPQKRMKINFRPGLTLSAPFGQWLDRMIEPSLEQRFHSAHEALQQLQSLRSDRPALLPVNHPKGSPITIKKSPGFLSVTIPHYHTRQGRQALLSMGCVGIGVFVAVSFLWAIHGLLGAIALLMVPVYGVSLIRAINLFLTRTMALEFTPRHFKIVIKEAFYSRIIQGKTRDLSVSSRSHHGGFCYGGQVIMVDPLGGYLTEVEKRWIQREVGQMLGEWRDLPPPSP